MNVQTFINQNEKITNQKILPNTNYQGRLNDQFNNFQSHLGIGKDGNHLQGEGGIYEEKYKGLNNSTENKSELMLVDESEANEQLPPNMPNFDPFLE